MGSGMSPSLCRTGLMQGWHQPRGLSRTARPRLTAGLDGAYEAVWTELCLRELVSVRFVIEWPRVLPQGARAFAIRGFPGGSAFDPSWFTRALLATGFSGILRKRPTP